MQYDLRCIRNKRIQIRANILGIGAEGAEIRKSILTNIKVRGIVRDSWKSMAIVEHIFNVVYFLMIRGTSDKTDCHIVYYQL